MELSREQGQQLAYMGALADLMAEKGIEYLCDGQGVAITRTVESKPVVIPTEPPQNLFPLAAPDPLSDPVTFGSNGVPTLLTRP